MTSENATAAEVEQPQIQEKRQEVGAVEGDPHLPGRRPTPTVDIGAVKVGSRHPIVVQSMTNTDTADADAASASNENVKTLPFPTSLTTIRSPRINRAKFRLIVNPRPVPPLRTTDSAWSNASKILSRCAGAMPGPVSSTVMITV